MRLGSIHSPSPASALWLWASIMALLSVRAGGELVACGTVPGRANFPADGNALMVALRCYSAGQWCTSGNLANKASIQAYYGNDINDWCTGEVTSFENMFRNAPVCWLLRREDP